MGRKLAVLLSGGVDSSAVAYLVKEQNRDAEVVAFTLLLYKNGEDIENARRVAEFLKIPHEVLDLREEFRRRIIENFVSSYRKGETPNPCAVCNQQIKLGLATEILTSEGFEKIYTGHYVRKVPFEGHLTLARGKDLKKDQSYFLALLRPEYLPYLEFPLGGFTKEEVRRLAERVGLPTKSRKESQDICFLEGRKLKDFLRDYIPPQAGFFLYKGKVVGKHSGYYTFTVGQRRGLGVRLGKPVYVKEIDAEKNAVILGDKDEILTNRVLLRDLNLFVEPKMLKSLPLEGQVRYRTEPKRVREIGFTEGGLEVVFEEPFFGVAKGQIGALYTADGTLVAGGVIT